MTSELAQAFYEAHGDGWRDLPEEERLETSGPVRPVGQHPQDAGGPEEIRHRL